MHLMAALSKNGCSGIQVFVWKELGYRFMSESDKKSIVTEVNLLKDLKNKHIVRYEDRIVDKSKQILYLVMEYCDRGDLQTYIKKQKLDGFGSVYFSQIYNFY